MKMQRRASAVLVTLAAALALAGGCAGHGSSSQPALDETTTSTDALDAARAQLRDVNSQLSQVADDSKEAQSGLDDNEGDTNP
jgi:ABC-type glycerol-3-phosphate transport system substrate-binding protein